MEEDLTEHADLLELIDREDLLEFGKQVVVILSGLEDPEHLLSLVGSQRNLDVDRVLLVIGLFIDHARKGSVKLKRVKAFLNASEFVKFEKLFLPLQHMQSSHHDFTLNFI